MTVIIYHNPRCATSRKVLGLLRAKGVEPRIVEYLKTPPSAAELKQILKKLGIGPRDLIRKKESPYKQLKLDNPKLSDDALVRAMAENPILIERPVLTDGARAVLARSPEKALEIL